jgi:uncharacterized membrane protein
MDKTTEVMGSEYAETATQFPSHVKEPAELPTPFKNVGTAERVISGLLGAALASRGLWKRGFGGMALAAMGGSLIYRGVTGHCDMYKALNINTVKS